MNQSKQNQRVGYFPTVGSATIRRNLIGLPLLRVVNNSDNVVNENGTDLSPDTRLLHSPIHRRLALLSIYSAQHLRDREQSTLCAVNSYWFAVNSDKENRNIGVQDRCHIYWFHLWRVSKSKLSSVSSLSKEPFREHRILGNELVCRSGNASHQRGYAVEWNSAKWQSRLSNHVLFTSNRTEYMAI